MFHFLVIFIVDTHSTWNNIVSLMPSIWNIRCIWIIVFKWRILTNAFKKKTCRHFFFYLVFNMTNHLSYCFRSRQRVLSCRLVFITQGGGGTYLERVTRMSGGKDPFLRSLSRSTRAPPPLSVFSVPQDPILTKNHKKFPTFCSKCLNYQFLSLKIAKNS